ncbi:hypothetical protein PYCC9005_002494 [Savitreella phatthalungensis]
MAKKSAQDLLAGLDALPDDSTLAGAKITTDAESGPVDDEASINDFLAEFSKERERPSRPITPALASKGAGARNSPRPQQQGRVAGASRSASLASAPEDISAQRKSTDSTRSRGSNRGAAGPGDEVRASSLSNSTTMADVSLESSKKEASDATAAAKEHNASTAGGSSWGSWGSSLWSTATKVQSQLRSEAERRLAELQASEEAQRLQNRLRELDLSKLASEAQKLGSRALEVVAPPISRSETLKVHVVHDLRGVHVEENVGRAFDRAMEQVEGGRLRIHAADLPAQSPRQPIDLNAEPPVLGYDEARKMCVAAIDAALRGKEDKSEADGAKSDEAESDESEKVASSGESDIYVAIQAFVYHETSEALTLSRARVTSPSTEKPDPTSQTGSTGTMSADDKADDDEFPEEPELHLLVLLRDPENGITLSSVSQGVPPSWVDSLSRKRFDQTAYQPSEWVCEFADEALSGVASVVAQRYVVRRMGIDRASREQDQPTET